ncbi:MAG: SOSS complex subunit B family protein [Candidatus Nanoarchaeia archaeon]
MKIAELQARQGKVELEAKVVEKQESRTFEKFGEPGRVCNATIEDDTGKVILTLWNEDVDKVNVGDTVKISNGYVGEWQGNLQLSTGKFGTLEVKKGEGGASEPKEEPKPDEPKPEDFEAKPGDARLDDNISEEETI